MKCRDHTEEWKGWMQVMFVWYHYFAAKEWYNWIRIYIACYVWMTGFGKSIKLVQCLDSHRFLCGDKIRSELGNICFFCS